LLSVFLMNRDWLLDLNKLFIICDRSWMAANVPTLIQQLLQSKDLTFLLASVKGLRNGLVYGVKVRAPHALVMTFLFGNGNLVQKITGIVQATVTHSRNLGSFVFLYKLCSGSLQKLSQETRQLNVLISAFAAGYFIFGKYNAVNMQINLYLLSRILLSLSRLSVEKGYIVIPGSRPVFPWFAAIVWGTVLWLFEFHQDTLQPSLQNSMTYLYHDSNFWTNFKNFIFVNK